jgi:hypothetical protein
MHNAEALDFVCLGLLLVALLWSYQAGENNSAIERWPLDFTVSRADQIGTTS